ncbi:hypothetical protein [Belnapia rosea]|uniref:Uncharacterized protein n=1 Tax=Belnapia rosea TaxID=938405 RepID=A0A1G6RMI2_9PROT|nr:hypothetical protein [Belnapia rosea]SDD05862.1 hypothetical protein SAMN04487779_100468 [Belnapia rosea]
MSDGAPPCPQPPWLSDAALTAVRAARCRPGAFPRPGDAGGRAVREAVLAHHPALPFTLIAEAVAYILGSE